MNTSPIPSRPQAPAAPVLPASLNGLEPALIEQAVAGIAADPANAKCTFRAKTTWQGGLRTRTDVESYELGGKRIPHVHRIFTDEPIDLLGTEQAPNPQDLLLSALSGCMTVGFVVGATMAGLRIDSLQIETECPLDLRGAFGLDPSVKPGAEKITYTIRVKGSGTREQFEAVHQEMMAVSPNRYHLTAPIPLESRLVVE
jgi:uncharacterized OsmC-like protein